MHYEETTKTLTVTGDDSGLNNMQNILPDSVLNNMENIVFKDCKVSGSLSRLLRALKNITSVKFENFDIGNVTDMDYMFYGCSSLATLHTPKTMTTGQDIDLPDRSLSDIYKSSLNRQAVGDKM